MDFSLLQSPSFLLLSSLLLLLLLTFRSFLRRKLPFPPGPLGFPIIGNMLIIDQLNHRGLAKLAKTYGGILHLRLGVLHMVAVSTPEMAREVLQIQDIAFANRPANVAISYLTYDRADMAFANYGPLWRKMRKICVMKLFSRKRAESWASVREEVDDVIRTVSSRIGEPINLGELIFGLTRNITYKAAFGSNSHEGQDDFVKILQEFSKLFGAFDVADFLPWMSWIRGKGFYERMEKARKELDVFIDSVIDEHMKKKKKKKKKKKEDEDEDMVDELIAFLVDDDSSKNEIDDSQAALKLTRDNIKAIVMDVMFGGTETVASVIEWTMAELLKSPNELIKVQQELTDVIGLDRKFNESDLDNLPYLKLAVKETLRLHPPIPLLLHETAVDTVVVGYSIPKGSRVYINAWAIGRDKNSWTDPDKFNPSRFMNENAADFKGSDFEFLPFGSGRRSCPGMQLGLYACEMAVANLLHSFKWELPNGMKCDQLDMNDVFGLTAPRAIQLVAVPSYRLHLSAIEFEGKRSEDH